jgi:hypothetical protein
MMDAGNLSRLVKELAKSDLIESDEKHPRLLIKIPATFFEGEDSDEQ